MCLLAIARCRAGFIADCRGISAVEFAMLLPVILTLYLGTVEASQGIAADRKVELTAHALADLSSQYTDITNAEMTNILNAGSAIIAPYAAANLKEVVSEIAIDAQGIGHGGVERHAQRHGARGRHDRQRAGLACDAKYLSGAGPGPIQLQSDLRLRDEQHFDLERSKFHAAAGIGLDRAHGADREIVRISAMKSTIA